MSDILWYWLPPSSVSSLAFYHQHHRCCTRSRWGFYFENDKRKLCVFCGYFDKCRSALFSFFLCDRTSDNSICTVQTYIYVMTKCFESEWHTLVSNNEAKRDASIAYTQVTPIRITLQCVASFSSPLAAKFPHHFIFSHTHFWHGGSRRALSD